MSAYQAWISRFNKATAQAKILDLQNKVARTMAAAHRSARRHEDAGPLDIAHERVAPHELAIELLKLLVAGKKPSAAQLADFEKFQNDKDSQKQWRDDRKAAASKHPSLIGWTIFWKGKYGAVDSGVVQKQKPGKWSDTPTYSVVTPQGARWRIPDGLVTKKVKPADLDQVVKGIVRQKDKILKKTASLIPGQTVEWYSKRNGGGYKSGKVIRAGRTRVKVDVGGLTWTVPMTLVTKVDGKKV